MKEDWMTPSIVVAIVMLLALIIYSSMMSAARWEEFKSEHECKIVAHIAPSNGVGISSSGSVVVTVNPAQKGWLCNDGKTYYRE